jgi:hypothetical protein
MMIMALDPTQAATLPGTSTRTNFKRIEWTRAGAVKPGRLAVGRSIHLQTFVESIGPRRRSINMVGTVTETSVSDLMDDIRSIIQSTYPSDMFEFAEALSMQLEYALSKSHCTTIVNALKDSEGTCHGELVISFGPH